MTLNPHHAHSPSKSTARDAAQIGRLLERALPPGLRVERCELESWRPAEEGASHGGAAFLSSYRVTIADPGRGTRRTQLYCGRTFAGDGDISETLDAAAASIAKHAAAPVPLPALRTLLYAFPHDPALPALPRCLSREAVEACVRREGEVASFEVAALKYDPGRGCTLRFVVTMRRGAVRILIGKMHANARLARTYGTLLRLESSSVEKQPTWRFARPLGYDEELRMLWQEALPGRPFWEIHERLDLGRVFRAMASSAAAMHATSFAPAGRKAKPLVPSPGSAALAASPREFQRRHAAAAARLGEIPSAPGANVSLHGDFHPNQFMIDGNDVGLADFDKACWGDPGFDLGCFASHVILKSVQGGLDPERFMAPLEGFFSHYAERSGRPGVRRSAAWHTAVQLLGRRTQKLLEHDAEPAGLDLLLDFAERFVEEACARDRVRVRTGHRVEAPRG